jgi:penicillin-binding protein 1A
MPRLAAGVLGIALIATACSVEPIEDPGLGTGSLTSTVYAVDGSIIAEWHAGEDRVPVAYAELPAHLVDAVVAIEDQRFWVHSGVDPRAIARAASANLEAGAIVQGGSTITQQYVKNVLLTSDATLERKIEEAELALRLEETLTKEEILERYLNAIFMGEGAYGIGAAALRYFGTPVGSLTLGESALLAGLVNSPIAYNPYEHPDEALARRGVVLDKMVDLGWVDAGAAAAAAAEPLRLMPRSERDRSPFPYFTEEVRRRLLAEPALGAAPEERFEALHAGGLQIFTTLDPTVQRAAEAAVLAVVPDEGPDAAVVAIDPRTGHVLAIVGGRDYYDPDDPIAQFNLATQGLRQPGSAFKPFVLAAAVEAGVGLDRVLEAGPTVTLATDSGDWTVANHEHADFPDLTLREATVFSVNTVYARLIQEVGPERVAEIASAAGITTPLDPLPSLALGAQEVTVFDMASAYATFAGGGVHVAPTLITRIEDADGHVVFEPVPAITPVLEPEVAADVTSTLTEVVRRGTGQQAKIGRPVAGKTGTTESSHDAWFVGYTPELVAAVWVGFGEGNRPLTAPHTPFTITGGSWPAQIWSRFAIGALSGVPYAELPDADPDGLVAVEIDLTTGFLAGPLCPRSHTAEVRVPASAVPTIECPIHNPADEPVRSGLIPDVVGRPVGEAVAYLEAAGYRTVLAWDVDADAAPGVAVAQRPAAGTRAAADSDVTVTLSGPEPGTSVPSVVGERKSVAITDLATLGIPVEVFLKAEDEEVPPERQGRVWAQVPPAGSPAEGPVTIWVNPETDVDPTLEVNPPASP